jgi:hypothetical protein
MSDESENKMNLWQKLTIDWPCAVGDWLWANIAVPTLGAREQLTFRRVIYVAALIMAVMAFAQISSLDLAFWAAGDVAFYCEIASAVMFVVVKGHARQLLQATLRKLRTGAMRASLVMRRHAGAMRQRRNANALRRKRGVTNPEKSDDKPAAWSGALYSFA